MATRPDVPSYSIRATIARRRRASSAGGNVCHATEPSARFVTSEATCSSTNRSMAIAGRDFDGQVCHPFFWAAEHV